MVMPNAVKMYPRGYSGGQASPSVVTDTREGDPEVVQLFERYTGPEARSTDWEFRKQVIKAAIRLLGGSGNWFVKQDINPMVQDYNYQFLADTLKFIATGRRDIHVVAWQDLLTHAPNQPLKTLEGRHELGDRIREFGHVVSVEALIQKWCSQPNGFDDLMFSMHLMFGRMDMRYDYED